MKKITAEFLLQLLFGVAAIALMIGGAIMFVASFFVALPMFNAVMLMVAGAIMYTGVRLYFMFLETMSSLTGFVEQLKKATSPLESMKSKLSPDFSLGVETIKIDSSTTPEQIEELKKRFPMVADQLDKILSILEHDTSATTSNIQRMSIAQLEKELEKAIGQNEFEKAAEIRDELKKRKV